MAVMMKKKPGPFQNEAVTQVHPMGCGVACVAFLTGSSYARTLRRFTQPEHAWTRGFYCSEIVTALAEAGLVYSWRKAKRREQNLEFARGTIVFIAPSRRYPHGHFLVQCGPGRLMNPWKNCPVMTPVKSGFERIVPGDITYVIEPAVQL